MERELEMGGELTVSVGIDHGQFIACDPARELDIDSYDDLAQRAGLAVWGNAGGLTVFTASHWTSSTVTVRLTLARPTVAAREWDHLVEAGLVLRSGRLNLYGPEDTNANESSVVVSPGTYSVIVSGKDFDATNQHGDEGTDTYALHLWPGPLLERRVLKDGFTWMD